MKAWLITREWFGDHAAPSNGEIVCLLNPRLSPERAWSIVERAKFIHIQLLNPRLSPERAWSIVEQLYVNEFGSLSEQAAYAKNSKSWPYPPQCGTAKTKSGKSVKWGYTITCGHNPWFHARPVKNVTVIVDNQEKETLKWEEIEKPLCADV